MAFARLTSYPPLNLLTVIQPQHESIPVTALFDWGSSEPEGQFEVVLCYATSDTSSKHPSLWSTSSLEKSRNPHVIKQGFTFQSTFHTKLLRSQIVPNDVLSFTFKYRVNPGAPWQWVQAQQAISPGQLILQGQGATSTDDLTNFLEIDSGWNLSRVSSTESKASVFKLESQAFIGRSDSNEDEARLTALALGKVKGQLQYFALVRMKPYWLVPRQGTSYFYLAEDALLCSFLTSSGKVLTIVTITGIDETYSIIQSNEQGQVVVAARCDSDKDVPFHALAAIGDTLEESSAAVMAAAREIVNVQHRIQEFAKIVLNGTSVAENHENEEWLDRLAFCTWNALGQDLTEAKILSALDSLSENKVNISTLLIDDNWQVLGTIEGHDYADSHNRGFADLNANSLIAPNGLPALIQKIRSSYPQIVDIGVWHALLGYWGGISPTGQIAKEYETLKVPTFLMGNFPVDMTCIGATSVQKFYDDLYSYLAQAGITFVKTDVQHMLSIFLSRSSRRALIPAYQTTWTSSHFTHFQGKAISCMSQNPEILWSSLLQTHTPPVVLRNSDDFWPEIPASHTWHIWTNAHNALFTRHLNVVLDWDMFQTKHTYSAYHAAARCISGGPILITDTPGEHDLDLIQQMTALDASGRSIALRPSPARTIRAFDEYVGGNILKIGATTKAGCSLLGLWNIAEKDVSTLVCLSEFLHPSQIPEKVVVRSFRSNEMFGPFDTSTIDGDQGVGAESLIYTTIPVREWDMLTMHPVTTMQLGGENVEIAVLGLVDKISGAAGILNSQITGSENATVLIKLDLKALGKVRIWMSMPSSLAVKCSAPRLVLAEASQDILPDNFETITFESNQPGHNTFKTSIDVEAEWTQRELFGSEHKDIRLEMEFSTR